MGVRMVGPVIMKFGIDRLLLGSQTSKVLAITTLPVVVCR